MRPVRIFIDHKSSISFKAAKYVFKTLMTICGFPWHFVNSRESGDIVYSMEKKYSPDCKIFIRSEQTLSEENLSDHEITKEDGIYFFHFKSTYSSRKSISYDKGVLLLDNDIVFSSYHFLIGNFERKLPIDKFGFHDIKDSFFTTHRLLYEPIINQYAILMRGHLSQHFDFLPSWPQGKKYAVVLTHDVDYPEIIKLIEALRHPIENWRDLVYTISLLKAHNPFWRFQDWMGLEREFGFKSSFHFCASKNSLVKYLLGVPDPFYEIRKQKFKDIIGQLSDEGFDVCLHASFNAYRSKKKLEEEKENLESILGQKVLGNRHHYWHLNPADPGQTLRFHQDVGLLFDMSICFEKGSGFRRGIASPFYPFDSKSESQVETLQLPTCLMDNHLFKYQYNNKIKDRFSCIDLLLKSVKEHEGILVVDYHVRTFDETFFKGWKASFIYLLESLRKNNEYYSDVPSKVSWYFKERKTQLELLSKDENCGYY